jgi:hypothetical protein
MFDIADPVVAGDANEPRIGFLLADDEAEEGRLPVSVPADDPDALPAVDL